MVNAQTSRQCEGSCDGHGTAARVSVLLQADETLAAIKPQLTADCVYTTLRTPG